MTKANGAAKVCRNGHKFYKTSDCPACPVCEARKKPKGGFVAELGAPARRALEREGITTVAKLSQYTESEILKLHGVGPSSLPKLRKALASEGKAFQRNPGAG
jgi:hypothetical protein